MVKFKGKPVADVDVEVEYWNADKKVTAPNDYFFTQVVKTDKNGIFTFAVPKAGWWGFAALTEEKQAIQHTDGKKKDAEYGAVLWVQFTDWPGEMRGNTDQYHVTMWPHFALISNPARSGTTKSKKKTLRVLRTLRGERGYSIIRQSSRVCRVPFTRSGLRRSRCGSSPPSTPGIACAPP